MAAGAGMIAGISVQQFSVVSVQSMGRVRLLMNRTDGDDCYRAGARWSRGVCGGVD